jgi:6-phosphogluconolactonase
MEETGTMSRSVHAFTKQDKLIEALSQSILAQLQEAIETKGKASLLVSGGSTPKPLFAKLKNAPLEWEKVTIGLCDERWVPASHADSNEQFVKEFLMQGKAGKASFVGMYNEGVDAHEAEELSSQKMRKLQPFDVVILGMGTDAHTASLFPENEKLEEAFELKNQNLCISIEPKTAPHMRMSLTLSAILSAEHLYLHFEGKEKLSVYEKAISGADRHTMPIRSVLNQDIKDIEVYYA